MPNKKGLAAFSTFRGLSSSANASNRAFVVEALILLAFLAVSVAIVLQLFAAAGVQSREAHKLSLSEHLATNTAEAFGANPTAIESMVYYDADGNKLETDVGKVYSVETTVVPQRTTTGTMYSANIVVTNYELRYDGNVIYELETQRYLSQAEGGGSA